MKKQTAQTKTGINLIEIFSWYGVIAIIAAYILVTLSILPAKNLIVIGLNITGSAGVLIDAWKSKNYQPVVINAIWIVVALIALVQLIR